MELASASIEFVRNSPITGSIKFVFGFDNPNTRKLHITFTEVLSAILQPGNPSTSIRGKEIATTIERLLRF